MEKLIAITFIALVLPSIAFGTPVQNCGKVSLNSKIVNGVNAKEGSFPWMTRLTSNVLCGGSLISDRWVLSAAHCFQSGDEGSITATFGDLKRSVTESTEQTRGVVRVIQHPSYNSGTLDYDYVLLELDSPVTINQYVNPICLPFGFSKTVFENLRKTCYITGWGTLSSGGSLPDDLQEAWVKVFTDQKCKSKYGSASITPRMFCANRGRGDNVRDTCQGDSGGPLACKDGTTNTWYSWGITSWGYGCAEKDFPGVYASVVEVISWISGQTGITAS